MATLRINSHGSTEITLTLEEKSRIDGDKYYTFLLVNKDSKEETVFCATDLSPYPNVYNKFVVTVSDNPLPLYGKISVTTGHYNYSVYESAQQDNLDISACTTLLEKGLATVSGINEEVPTTNNPSHTVKVWSQLKK